MRWKTKDKTYGIQKPAQHFVSWFLRISVSPLCPPPPPTPASLCPLPSFPSIPYPFLSPLSPLSPFFSLLYPFSPLFPHSPLSPLSTWYLPRVQFQLFYLAHDSISTHLSRFLPYYHQPSLLQLLSFGHPSLLHTLMLPASKFYPLLSPFRLPLFLPSFPYCFIPFLYLFLYLFFLPLHSLLRFLLVPLHIPSSFLGKPATSPLFVVSFNLLSIFARVKRFNSPQKRSYHPGEMAPLRSPYDFDDEGNATSTSTTEPSSSGFRSSVTSRFTTTDASETYGDEDSSVPGVWLKY